MTNPLGVVWLLLIDVPPEPVSSLAALIVLLAIVFVLAVSFVAGLVFLLIRFKRRKAGSS